MNSSLARAYIKSNLNQLQTSYVDLLLLHHTCSTPEETIMVWRVLEEAKKNGSAKLIGVSNFVSEDIRALLAEAKETVSVNQCRECMCFTF